MHTRTNSISQLLPNDTPFSLWSYIRKIFISYAMLLQIKAFVETEESGKTFFSRKTKLSKFILGTQKIKHKKNN